MGNTGSTPRASRSELAKQENSRRTFEAKERAASEAAAEHEQRIRLSKPGLQRVLEVDDVWEMILTRIDTHIRCWVLSRVSKGINEDMKTKPGWHVDIKRAKEKQASLCVACRIDDVWDTLPVLQKSICGDCIGTGTWHRLCAKEKLLNPMGERPAYYQDEDEKNDAQRGRGVELFMLSFRDSQLGGDPQSNMIGARRGYLG